LEPGLVTFAKASIRTWGTSPDAFVLLVPVFALVAALPVSLAGAGFLGFSRVCLPASQSSTLSGTPILTIFSNTQILAGL
jgi:hypothetical protein